METRANYLLIGAFTVAGFAGLLGFLFWFMRIELDRQFDYYEVVFPSVSGLSTASEVRFSGLLVGQVVAVALAPDGSGQVRVRLEMRDGIPVRTSSVASIETLGVTGVSYVAVTSGDPRDPRLTPSADGSLPEIQPGQSSLQSITEGFPELMVEFTELSRNLSALVGAETQTQVRAILENLVVSSGNLDAALQDFSDVTLAVSSAAEDIATFTARLDDIEAAAITSLGSADEAFREVAALSGRLETTLDAGDSALTSARTTLDTANGFINDTLPGLTADASRALAALRSEVDELGTDARATLAEFRETGELASARLREAEATIAQANTAIAGLSGAATSVQETAASVGALVEGEGARVVADARGLIASADALAEAALAVAEEDLPAILEDVRRAASTAAQTMESVGADLSAAAGRVDTISVDASETLRTVADTFETANGTLERLNGALVTGGDALSAAETAFTSADRVLNSEVGVLVTDLRATLDALQGAIASVSDSVPAIASDLRETAARANAAFGEVEATAGQLGPPLRSFASEGLPQYTRLATETRALITNLDRLVRQIERDPARYFLGQDAPAFRR